VKEEEVLKKIMFSGYKKNVILSSKKKPCCGPKRGRIQGRLRKELKLVHPLTNSQTGGCQPKNGTTQKNQRNGIAVDAEG
jgi:hypothetical protein